MLLLLAMHVVSAAGNINLRGDVSSSSMAQAGQPVNAPDDHQEDEKAKWDKLSSQTLVRDDVLWRMLVSPEHKLMACKIYKSGSSELSHLFSILWHDPDRIPIHKRHVWTRTKAGCEWLRGMRREYPEYPAKASVNCTGIPQEAITLHQFQPLTENASKLVSQPGWTRVMVAKDPLDRFVPGILETCGLHLETSKACPAKQEVEEFLNLHGVSWRWWTDTSRTSAWVRKAVVSIVLEKLETVAWEHRQMGKHWGYAMVDSHFRPSSSMCGAGSGLNFDDVILYDPRDFSETVGNLLHRIGVPIMDEILARRLDLLSSGNSEGDDSESTFGAFRSWREFSLFTPDMIKRIIRLYAEDYLKFRTMRENIPKWVDMTKLPDFKSMDDDGRMWQVSPCLDTSRMSEEQKTASEARCRKWAKQLESWYPSQANDSTREFKQRLSRRELDVDMSAEEIV